MNPLKKILVTGGSGYIAGRLINYLSTFENYQIIVATRNPDKLNYSVAVKKIDWNSTDNLKDLCKNQDVIIHVAGLNAQDCQNDPAYALEFNGVYTARLIDAAVKNKVSKFIYFSTIHVYSSKLEGILTENSPTANLHPYASSHLAAEKVLEYYHQQRVIEGICVRLSNSFGAPVDVQANCWMLLINDLCKQLVSTKKMVIRSSKNQKRDFITLTNTCRAISHLIEVDLKKMPNPTFNLGGNSSLTIESVVDKIAAIAEKLNFKFDVEYLSDENCKEIQLKYDLSKIISTGFDPGSIDDLDHEIRHLLVFCKENFK